MPSSIVAARLAPIATPVCPKLATIVETLTIEPHPRSAVAGASAATRKNGRAAAAAFDPGDHVFGPLFIATDY